MKMAESSIWWRGEKMRGGKSQPVATVSAGGRKG